MKNVFHWGVCLAMVCAVWCGLSTGLRASTASWFTQAPGSPITLGGSQRVVVTGDFNGDGIPDMATLDTANNTVSILLGKGDGTFSQASGSPINLSSQEPGAACLVAGYFTGNGILDLAVGDWNAGAVTILLGNGDGTFTIGQTITFPNGHIQGLVAGDFTGNGKIDLATADWGNSAVEILLGNGDGTFTKGHSYPAGGGATSICEGDFSNNGKLDLAVANFMDGTVDILLGNGDGTFTSGQTLSVGANPREIDAGDLTNNGHLDLAVANRGDGTVSILLGNGNGTFTNGALLSAGAGAASIAIGDFDRDGKQDLAVSDYFGGTVTLFEGSGSGTFIAAPGSPINVGFNPRVMAIGDFNRDGKPDLAVSNAQGYVSVFLNDSPSRATTTTITSSSNPVPADVNVTFTAAVSATSGGNPTGTVQFYVNGATLGSPVTLNSSGQASLTTKAFTAQGNYNVQAIYSGDANFSASSSGPLSYAAGTSPAAIAVGDFNGDGRPDLAMANSGSNTVSILLGAGGEAFTAGQTIPVGTDPMAIAAGDFAGNGKLDLAVANAGSNNVTILLGNGDGTFTAGQTLNVGTQPDAIAVGDFNGDGKLDLAVANAKSGTVSILLGNGDGTFSAGAVLSVGTDPDALAAADFNNDSRLDLAVANAGSNNVTILLGNGDGTFSAGALLSAGTKPAALVAGDFTNNGDLDLAVANAGSNNVSVFLGAGDGTFTAAAGSPVAVGTNPVAIAQGDFNRDGKLDLAVANNQAGTISILLGDGKGGFAPAKSSPLAVSSPAAMVVTDLNRDGDPDLAVANPNTFTTIFGDGMGGFELPLVQIITPPAPAVNLSSATLDFGGVAVNSTSPAKTVTITNAGNGQLTFSAFTVSGEFALNSSATTCSNSVPLSPGQTCAVGVTFTPQADGTITGDLTISDNAPGSPQTVTLTGMGADFSITPKPPEQSMPGTGQSAAFLLDISSTGGFAQAVNLSCSNAPPFAQCSVTPGSVTPTASGTATAMLIVKVNSSVSLLPGIFGKASPPYGMWLMPILAWLGLIILMVVRNKSPRWGAKVRKGAAFFALGLGLLFVAACGSSATIPAPKTTPPGTYSIQVVGTAGKLAHAADVQLTVP